MSERLDKPLIVLPGPVPGASATNTHERRTAPRLPFTASALVIDFRTQTRVTGRSGDMSSVGCYIDTISPFPVGTPVRVCVDHGLQQFEALATVTYAAKSMGMGLAFTEIKPEHQAILRKWIAELSGEESPEPEEVAAAPETGTLAEIRNLRQILNELINLMIRRNTISEKEGAELLRQVLR